MNILACSRHLLTHFSPEERDIPDDPDYPDRNAAVQAALNGALQELFGRGGKWVRQDDRGTILFAPTTVRITVATGSTAATIHTDDWQSWMAGCSIVIDGSAVDNQIRNASATVTLKYPHDGSSGATTGTVYCDSVTVASDALEVIEPVRLDRRQITPMPSPYAAQQGHPLGDFKFHQHSRDNPLPVARLAESASAPAGFVVETWAPDSSAQNQIRIRLWPAPDAQYVLDYKIMLKPPRIDYVGSLDELPVPFDQVETIFLPLAIKRLSQGPFWRGVTNEQAVNDSFKEAGDLLSKANPSPTSGVRFDTRF